VYDRGNSGVLTWGETEQERKKNDGEIQMWERGTRREKTSIVRKEKKEVERQSSTCGMDAAK
jgi:hypothetical protein